MRTWPSFFEYPEGARIALLNLPGLKEDFTFCDVANTLFETSIRAAKAGDLELAARISDWASKACVISNSRQHSNAGYVCKTKKRRPEGGPGAASRC